VLSPLKEQILQW